MGASGHSRIVRHGQTADSERFSVLIRLLRTYLRPYKKPIGLLVLLQLLQTCATLYLPTLNADIIDNGVVKGDTGYILRFGALMIGVSLVQVVCNIGAVYYGARTAVGARPGRPRRRLRPGAVLLGARGRPVRRALADHPYDQ